MQGSGACWSDPASHGTVKLRLRKPSNAPQGQRIGGYGFPHKNQTSQITIFRKPPGGSLAKAWVSAETAASEVGTWRETKPGYPPYPPPPTRFGAVREKGRGFSPSPPSATIQHGPQGRRTQRFPEIMGTILGVSIIRIIVFWGLYKGPLILRKYHFMGS